MVSVVVATSVCPESPRSVSLRNLQFRSCPAAVERMVPVAAIFPVTVSFAAGLLLLMPTFPPLGFNIKG